MNLPIEFTERLLEILPDECSRLLEALDQESSTSIRVNRRKSHAVLADPVRWCSEGYYLSRRPAFTFDPLFHAGAYYVQEASSMFLSMAMRQYINTPVSYLDLCAAPGGKTTLALGTLPQGSFVVANEVIRSRAHILAENVTKWGNPSVAVINQQPERIGRLTHFFDVIAADVPCSGEGMFRKDSGSIDEWSVDNVRMCAARQREIVESVWDALAPGGYFLYSTCTYNLEENEENVLWMMEQLGAESLPVVHAFEEIHSSLKKGCHAYRFFPHRTRGEGFFFALLRKPDGERVRLRLKKDRKQNKGGTSIALPKGVERWLIHSTDFQLRMDGTTVRAIPLSLVDQMALLREHFPLLVEGVEMAEVKGKDLIPSPGLAFSEECQRDQFQIWELTYEQAIAFLRRDSIGVTEYLVKGYTLCLYHGYPLGWVKILEGRSNNLYPNEWRIRSSYLPEELPEVL